MIYLYFVQFVQSFSSFLRVSSRISNPKDVCVGGYRRRGGLMVSALDSGASGPGSGPGRKHCVVFLGKTLNSHGASLHPGV